MNILVDTNLLTRAAEPAHSMHQVAVKTVAELLRRGDRLCVVPQGTCGVVGGRDSTGRRKRTGNGAGRCGRFVTAIQLDVSLLPESPDTFERWQELVSRYGVRGKNAHDARLVAAMLVHGLTHVLTFNSKDFARFAEVVVIPPDQFTSPSTAT